MIRGRDNRSVALFSYWALWASEDDVTVYAYKMKHQARFGSPMTSDPWYRLTADTEDELHAFAARLGLPRPGVQPGTLDRPQQVSVSWHYTVTAGQRDRAIELGAQATTQREVTKMERQRAAELGVI
jgi:hypothetical protein